MNKSHEPDIFPPGKETLKTLLAITAAEHPDRPALSFLDEIPVTYAEVLKRVSRLSHDLMQRGIKAGDRVALLSESMPNWGIAFFAITVIGAVAVPILPDFHAADVKHILEHSGAKALFVSEKLAPKTEGVGLPVTWLTDTLEPVGKNAGRDGQNGSKSAEKDAENGLQLPAYEPGEDDLAVIIYTSGTTGHSKGVMLTHRNLVFDVLATLKIQPVSCEDRLISILPLSHSYECTIGFLIPFLRGAHIVYLSKPPVPAVLLPAMAKVRPTMMMTVPLIMEKVYKKQVLPQLTNTPFKRTLMKNPVFRKLLHRVAAAKIYRVFGGKLHFFGIGGALLSEDTETFLRDGKFPYAIGYGLTETAPLIAGCSPKVTKYRSTGVVIPGVEVQIHDPNPETHEGEIWVRGANVMKGYYKDEKRTAEVLDQDGWFKTGDLGFLDKDGYLFIRGRLKNMILGPNGENIYPEELESLFNKSDYVVESLVFQEQDQLTASVFLNYDLIDSETKLKQIGEHEIASFIKNKLEELRHFVNSHRSGFSRIKRIIEHKEPFEKTPTQKIKRFLYTK